jgi:hypothetical protein
MRNTKQEDRDFEQIMAMVKDMSDNVPANRTRSLSDGVWAMLVICIPVLTISTVLWQWLG